MSDYPANATPNPPAPVSSDLRVYVDADGNIWGRDYATGIGYLLSSPQRPVIIASLQEQINARMPLSGIASLGQVGLLTQLDDPAIPGVQGSAIVFNDAAGGGSALLLSTKYIIWKTPGGATETGIYCDASGDLYAYQLIGPNATRRFDITKGHWQ
jgi:streptogramin lyase